MTSEQLITQEELVELYRWVDAVPFSKQRKNIARDFSDGVAVAKLVQFYLPRMVELQMHNYVSSFSSPQKRINWDLLNRKVFAKLNLKLNEKLVDSVIEARPGAIELILFDLKRKVMELSPLAMSSTTLMVMSQGQGGRSVFKRTRSHHPSRPVTAAPAFTSVAALSSQRQGRSLLPPRPVSACLSVCAKVNSHRTAAPPTILRKKAAPPVETEAVPQDHMEFSLTSHPIPAEEAPPQAKPEEEVKEPSEPSSPPPPTDFPSSPSASGDTNANNKAVKEPEEILEFPPDELFYKGHLMVPATRLEKRGQQVKDMEYIITSLTKKVNFLDKLITEKDVRLAGMSQEVQRLRLVAR